MIELNIPFLGLYTRWYAAFSCVKFILIALGRLCGNGRVDVTVGVECTLPVQAMLTNALFTRA
jgi:hypothetical protein